MTNSPGDRISSNGSYAVSERARFSDTNETDYALPLNSFLQIVWKRLWVIVLVTLILVGTAVGFGLAQTPVYEANVKILVGQKQAAGDPYSLAGDVAGLQQLTQTLATAVSTRPIMATVTQRLDLSVDSAALLENLTVQPIPDTQFIQVTYKDTSPERAQRVANTIGDVFSERISGISSEASGVTATVWEAATAPEQPVKPNFTLLVPMALVLGLLLGLVLAVLIDYLDSSWRSLEEVEHTFGIPVVGAIPVLDVSRARRGASRGRSKPTRSPRV
jgi:capsular polysaccharide biosynthesis protein